MEIRKTLVGVAASLVLLTGAGAAASAASAQDPTATPVPTTEATPDATATPEATATPDPVATPDATTTSETAEEELAFTGSELTLAVAGIGLLGAGGALLIGSRRRDAV